MLTRTRRHLAVAAGGIVSVLLAAACSPGGDAQAGRPGGNAQTLTIAIPTDPTSLDPCDSQAADGVGTLRRNVTESLTDVDAATGKVVPLLALSWRQDDPTTWTFKLRPGVKFQDGTAFDAKAAAFNIKRTMQPDLGCLNLGNIPEPFTATAVDATTLKVVTKGPDPILPLRIGWIDMVSPKTSMTAKTAHPVGTGPYTFVRRTPGTDMRFKRFDRYWGTKAQAREVRYVFRSEASVRAATGKTGEADIAVPIALQDATENDRTRSYTQSRVFFLRLDTDKPPLNDLKVRQAIGYAIDKKNIVKALMGKTGKPTDQMVAPTVNGYIPGYKGPGHDPAKAKALIGQAEGAGVDTGRRIELISRNTLFPGSGDVLQAIIQNLKDVGLDIKLTELDENAYRDKIHATNRSGQPVSITAVSHDNAFADASFSFPKYLSSSGTVSTIRESHLDSLLRQADVAEGAERASLYQQAARWAYERNGAIVPVAEQFSLLLLNRGVEYKPNGLTGIELQASQVKLGR
ncbi:ABC transporter substrate-binding protein [Streptomyces sp. NPDC050546]|uniref:ABC transporter substrate-binding protein n=1 Tax=Streptomyces sp. NPDC050546 TaxID=3365628 RepID=UPI0037905EEA